MARAPRVKCCCLQKVDARPPGRPQLFPSRPQAASMRTAHQRGRSGGSPSTSAVWCRRRTAPGRHSRSSSGGRRCRRHGSSGRSRGNRCVPPSGRRAGARRKSSERPDRRTEAGAARGDSPPAWKSGSPRRGVGLGKPSHGVPGVTGTDGAEEGPTPALLDAVTVKLYAWVVFVRPLIHVDVVAPVVATVVPLLAVTWYPVTPLPTFDGALHNRLTWPLKGMATSVVGAPGMPGTTDWAGTSLRQCVEVCGLCVAITGAFAETLTGPLFALS